MRAPEGDLPIVFEDVSLRIGTVTVLDRIQLTLANGAPTLVIGPNGAGKTTLLRLAMGLASPSAGRITWGGRAQVEPRRRAFVFQHPVMLRRSAVANLRYALAQAGVAFPMRAARAQELLALVGLGAHGRRPARQLSGGETQRLALARALAKEPSVLFLDEPTGSLDPAAAKAIEDLIRTVAGAGVKVVMSTHDLGAARRLAGEVVLMHRGCVVETAPADRFFSAPASEAARRFLAGELLL